MSHPATRSGEPFKGRRVSYAVVRGEVPQVFMAEDETVMARVLALELCANLSPRANQGQPLGRMRELLLNEEWVEAVSEWMLLTGEELDVYPDEPIWTRADLSDEQASFEIRLSPIFRDQERD